MSEKAAWASYLYRGTNVLRNKLGLRDQARLTEAESFFVKRRTEQIRSGVIAIPRTFDLAHLKKIHAALFVDVYPWSGEIRTVHIGRPSDTGEATRWFLPPSTIEPALQAVTADARSIDWANLPRFELVENIAQLHTFVNYAHIFRDGNGRSSRLFFEHLIESSPYRLDFARVSEVAWTAASRDSIRPGRPGQVTGPPLLFEPQVAIFDKIVVDAPPRPLYAAAHVAQLGFAMAPTTLPTSQSRASMHAHAAAVDAHILER